MHIQRMISVEASNLQSTATIDRLTRKFKAKQLKLRRQAEESREQLPPEQDVAWYQLLRFASKLEMSLMLIAISLAIVNGFILPVSNIIYGEFTNLMVDRTVGIGTSTKTTFLAIFGGGKILTNASKTENQDALIIDSQAYAMGTLAFAFIQFILCILCVDIFNFTALKQVDRLKEAFLRSVLRQDIAWYDVNTSMNFASKVSDDLEKYKEGISEKVPIFIYLVTTLVSSIIIGLVYGWKLTLVVLATAPLVMIATLIVGWIQSKLTSKELTAYGKASVVADEVLGNIRTVMAFGGEDNEIKRYSKLLEPTRSIGRKKGVYSGLSSGFMWLMIYASNALSFWYGIKLVLESRHETVPTYTIAALMLIILNIEQGSLNVGLTIPHYEAIVNARSSAQSIFAVLDRTPVIDSLSTEGTRPTLDGEIELINVQFIYPTRPDVKILNGFNIKIRKGEAVALIGHSGCGKSTVIQLIQRMYDPTSGQVLMSGHDIKTMNVRHLRNHIAVVGQEPVLFTGTIRENIRISNPACTEDDIINAAKDAYCHAFIKSLPKGYDTMIGERGAQLSGGQKQRIAIARALVRKPMILLLDEATSALDSESESKVQKALDRASIQRTTIIISHRLSTVLNADRIVFLQKGVVVEEGTHAELLEKRGYFYELVMATEPGIGITPSNVIGDIAKAEASKRSLANLSEHRDSQDSQSSQTSQESPPSRFDFVDEKVQEEEFEPTTWKVLKLCKPEKYLMLFGIVAAFGVGATFPMFAVVFGEVFGILESQDEAQVAADSILIAILFLCIGLYTSFFIFIEIFFFNLTGVRLTERLRVEAYKSMLAQEIGWFDDPKNSVGALCSRLAADAAAVQGASGSRIGALMCAFSTIFIATCMSMYFSWSMTLVSIISVPLIIGAVMMEARVLSSGSENMKASMDKATTIASEAISNIKTVSAFCGEETILAKYQEAGAYARKIARNRVRLRGIVFGFGQTAPIAAYALALWFGGVKVAYEEMHYKDVIKVSEAMIFGAIMMGQALAFAPNFGAALDAAGRVMTLLARKPKVRSTSAPSLPDDYVADGKVDYEKIRFRYPTRREVQVLRGMSLSIPAGKQVALVGPSGCGKSTLIQLLQRQYDPDSGTVYLDDYSIFRDISLTTLRRNLSIVSQEPVLFNRTIAENIAYGDLSRKVGISEIVQCAIAANVHKFIASLPNGYNTRVGARASQLSGGQKQRIAIARALLRNPRILLLDEATSALDASSERKVQHALDKAIMNRTCIVVAHRLTTIVNSDIIYVIERGEIIESGNHSELMRLGGLYARLFDLQRGTVESESSTDDDA